MSVFTGRKVLAVRVVVPELSDRELKAFSPKAQLC